MLSSLHKLCYQPETLLTGQTLTEFSEESLSAFVLKCKIWLQSCLTVLKQKEGCQISVQDLIQEARENNWHWINGLSMDQIATQEALKLRWVLRGTTEEHTFHLQVKLSQMDLQRTFYKAHVLEERLSSHWLKSSVKAFLYMPFSCLILKRLWLVFCSSTEEWNCLSS